MVAAEKITQRMVTRHRDRLIETEVNYFLFDFGLGAMATRFRPLFFAS